MKEFNLNHALNGLPVVTRAGRTAMHVCTINNEINGTFYFWKVFEDNSECLVKTDKTGKAMPGNMIETEHLDYHDLFMAPVKKQEWFNVYSHVNSITMPYSLGGGGYPSEDAAKEAAEKTGLDNYVKSVLIREWEE